MAVTITKDYFAPYKTNKSGWNGITEWTSPNIKGNHAETTVLAYWQPESNLSSACRITKVSVKYDFRSNKNSLLADSLNANRIDTYVRLVSSGAEFAGAGSWHTRYVDAGWLSNVVDEYNCNQPVEEFYVRYRIQTDDSMVAYTHSAKLRNLYCSYTRTRACYVTYGGEGYQAGGVQFVCDHGTVPNIPLPSNIANKVFKGWKCAYGPSDVINKVFGIGQLPKVYETSDYTFIAVWEDPPQPPIFNSVSMIHNGIQISSSNKVLISQGFIISVGVK